MKINREVHFGHNEFILDSGRTFCANCHIVGIAPDLDIYEGYDGIIYPDGEYGWPDYEKLENVWTAEERADLADYMIDLWQKFKDKKV